MFCAVFMSLSEIIKAPLDCCQKHTEQAGSDCTLCTIYHGSSDLTLTHCPRHHVPEALCPQLLIRNLVQDPSWPQVPAQKPTQSCSKYRTLCTPKTLCLPRPRRKELITTLSLLQLPHVFQAGLELLKPRTALALQCFCILIWSPGNVQRLQH